MITREILTEQYNRVVVNHLFDNGDMLCTVQMIENEVVVWEENNIIFFPDMIQLTEKEINTLSDSLNNNSAI
jgi:hypothetical protein